MKYVMKYSAKWWLVMQQNVVISRNDSCFVPESLFQMPIVFCTFCVPIFYTDFLTS